MRLIDADALKKYLSEFNYDMALRIVDIQPTIKPEERHGRWTKDGCEHRYFYYRCSICGAAKDGRTKFCPDCGSRMDGEEVEENETD